MIYCLVCNLGLRHAAHFCECPWSSLGSGLGCTAGPLAAFLQGRLAANYGSLCHRADTISARQPAEWPDTRGLAPARLLECECRVFAYYYNVQNSLLNVPVEHIHRFQRLQGVSRCRRAGPVPVK